MKQKKIVVTILIAVISLAIVGCSVANASHKHTFGEWETKTPASCESAEVEARICECGEEETREGDPATGHTFTSITAESKLEKPMAGLTVKASDLSVTAVCECGERVAVTDGITIENASLTLGKNTVTVKCGDLSTILNIEAEKLDIVLDGDVTDDTHISSGSKDKENSSKKEMGTKVDEFRAYLRINVVENIDAELFAANRNNAKVQLVLPITGGSATDKTTFKLRTFTPAAGVTDVDFSKLTWNNVDKNGMYSGLNWGNGTVLMDTGVGHNVSAGNDQITITLAYSQIADFVDENGNIVFAFATNTDGLKIGSLENKTEANRPAIKIILNDAHFHVFDQKLAESKYFVSAYCKDYVRYHLSCVCGEAGTETFAYGGVLDHAYGEAIPEKLNTCTEDGVKEHYQCSRCGKYFLDRDGQMKLVKAEDVKLSAGHDYKLIEAKEPTCTEAGNHKYFKCGSCGLYFDADKKETTKEAQKIDKLPHSYGELIAQKDATCTEDGVKAHYECGVCHKTFLEKNGEKVAVNAKDLKISAGHEYKMISEKATCTKPGWEKHYKCELCGAYFDADKNEISKEERAELKIDKLPHTEETIPGYAATCTETGLTDGKKCTVCGEITVEQEEISAGHKYKMISEKATCTNPGWEKHYKCELCGAYFDADKNEISKEERAELKIDKLPHTEETIPGYAATCTETGLTDGKKCSVCKKVLTDQTVIPALGHTEETIPGTATCTEAGLSDGKRCTVCGEITVEQTEIPALGHTEETIPGTATCTEAGLSDGKKCAVCGEILVAQEEISALGHDMGVVLAKTPTCTEAGYSEHMACNREGCDYVENKEDFEKTTHNYNPVHEPSEATCTKHGWSTRIFKCNGCGNYFINNSESKKVMITDVDQYKIPAVAHKENIVNYQGEATCTKDGWRVSIHKCTVCEKNFIVENGTQIVITDKAPYKLPKLGHDYDPETGKCTRCDEPES